MNCPLGGARFGSNSMRWLLSFSQHDEVFLKIRRLILPAFLLLLSVCPTNPGMADRVALPAFSGVRVESADKRVVLEVDAGGLFQLTKEGVDGGSQEGVLPYIPSLFLVPNSGERIILLGERGREVPTKGVTLLDSRGELIKELGVEEVFSEEAQRQWNRCIHCPFLTDAWVDNKTDVLVLLSSSAFFLGAFSQEEEASRLPHSINDLVAVRSLQDARPVPLWDAVSRAAQQPRSLARRILLSIEPGAFPARKLQELFADSEPSARQLAVALSLSHSGPDYDKVLDATLADCDLPVALRVRAASMMASRGQDRGTPVILLAAGVPRRKALRGHSRKDLCLRSLEKDSAFLAVLSGVRKVLPSSEWTPILAKRFRKGSSSEGYESTFLHQVAMQLAQGGQEGQLTLARLLMEYRDNRSSEAQALVRALRRSRQDPKRRATEVSKQEFAKWRVWAATLVEQSR